jgi:hypothetical protein
MISPAVVSDDWVVVIMIVLGAPSDVVTVVVTRVGLTAIVVSGVLWLELDNSPTDADEERGVIDVGRFWELFEFPEKDVDIVEADNEATPLAEVSMESLLDEVR